MGEKLLRRINYPKIDNTLQQDNTRNTKVENIIAKGQGLVRLPQKKHTETTLPRNPKPVEKKPIPIQPGTKMISVPTGGGGMASIIVNPDGSVNADQYQAKVVSTPKGDASENFLNNGIFAAATLPVAATNGALSFLTNGITKAVEKAMPYTSFTGYYAANNPMQTIPWWTYAADAASSTAFTAPYIMDAAENGFNFENGINIGLGLFPVAEGTYRSGQNLYKQGRRFFNSLVGKSKGSRFYNIYDAYKPISTDKGLVHVGNTNRPEFLAEDITIPKDIPMDHIDISEFSHYPNDVQEVLKKDKAIVEYCLREFGFIPDNYAMSPFRLRLYRGGQSYIDSKHPLETSKLDFNDPENFGYDIVTTPQELDDYIDAQKHIFPQDLQDALHYKSDQWKLGNLKSSAAFGINFNEPGFSNLLAVDGIFPQAVRAHELGHIIGFPGKRAFDIPWEDYFHKANNTEIAERISQVKNALGITDPNYLLTEKDFKRYHKLLNSKRVQDNNMNDLFSETSADPKKLIDFGNKYALGLTGLAAGTTLLNE